MKKNAGFYFKLFAELFMLSAFTLGGGYVIVPLMRKKFVEQLHWLEDAEMLDLVGIAQSTPGAMAVNTSILVGYKFLGVGGAFIGAAATVLPPLIIISLIYSVYSAFSSNEIVIAAMKGMSVAVAAVIVDAVISLIGGIAKTKSKFSLLVMAAAFILVYFFKVNLFLVILSALILGLVYTYVFIRRKGEKG